MKNVGSSLLIAACVTAVVAGMVDAQTPQAARSASAAAAAAPAEPDVATALGWWPEQRGVWTPIGWKDHLFRFNVVYNGTIIAAPTGAMDKPHIRKYAGQDVQLVFHPSGDGAPAYIPPVSLRLYRTDGGHGIQRWREDRETPVLQTDWRCQEGLVLRQEVFAYTKGAKRIETGVEPLYAWVRLSVVHVDEIRAPEKFFFSVQLSNRYYNNDYPFSLDDSVSLAAYPDQIKLKQKMSASPLAGASGTTPGVEIRDPDGKVRLQTLPGAAGAVTFAETGAESGVYNLKVELPAKVGAHTDLLVPMLVDDPAVIAEVAALGYDKALEQTESFWAERPATAARIHTPEPYINEAIRRNIQFAQVIAERNPENGDYAFLSGSYGYDALWSTPTSMISHMFLDLLGYHDDVAKHVELYKKHQGHVKPPGPAYEMHPGYYSTPKTLTAYDWLSDHGAILEVLSRHALLSGDKQFTDHWLDSIVKACEFIRDSCANTKHEGVKGVMPPAVATDTLVPTQAVWNQAWTYKGLVTSVELLKKLDHPRAAEFEKVAADFRSSFDKAFRAKIATAKQWTDDAGNRHPLLPTYLTPDPAPHIFDDAFLLDTGPLVLPWAGLFDANDPLMKSFGDYFRVGPPTKLWGPRSSPIARAILQREISTCEPCYSWNIVNSWQAGDREKFLEGMYSLFAGAISTQTYINSEHRNAMYGTVFVAPLMTWSLRQAVIDDQLKRGELHLLRMVPLAWVTERETTRFENMPTEFGPVDLTFRKSADGKSLDVSFKGAWRDRPGKIVLHTPPVPGLTEIRVNGQPFPAGGTHEIPAATRSPTETASQKQ